MKRLSFSTIGERLEYVDNRAIFKWCKRHGVYYFKDGKCWYVYEDDFLAHTQKPEIVEEKKTTNFIAGLKRFVPQTNHAKAFEKKFSHIS